MLLLLCFYGLLALTAAISAFSNAGWFVGLAGLLGPLLAVWAGIGIRASFQMGKDTVVSGFLIGGALYLAAYWLVSESGYFVEFSTVGFGGGTWILIGFLLGIFSTKHKYLEEVRKDELQPKATERITPRSREEVRDDVICSLPSAEKVWFAVPYPPDHPLYSQQVVLYERVEKQVDELMRQQEKSI